MTDKPLRSSNHTRTRSEDLTELCEEPVLPKLEGKEHQWEVTTFHSPTICEACGGLLWGLSKQGERCSVCKTIVHSQHKKDVPLCGHVQAEQSGAHSGQHEWYTKTFNRFTYCNVCRNLLVGLKNQGKCCELCRFVCHDSCKEEANKLPCLNYSQYTKDKNEQAEAKHFWREGNLTQSLEGKFNCIVCDKTCGSTQGLVDFFCVWCSRPCHTQCLKSAQNSSCKLGHFSSITLPPTAVIKKEPNQNTNNNTNNNNNDSKDEKDPKPEFGYAIDSQWLKPEQLSPVVILINKRSGGQQGNTLIRKFNRYLNPVQVFNIGMGGPKIGLEFMSQLTIPWKAVVCGGDGTVNWVLETIRSMNLSYRPPCAIVPLGTGNDLSRALGWGPGYEGESVAGLLEQITFSTSTSLDRWSLDIAKKADSSYGDYAQHNVMNNYFSIGVDARIALDFHQKRESDPSLFKSRTGNKLWYGLFGATAMFNGCAGLSKWIKVEIDGKDQILDKDMEGLIILNVQSYGGGVNMWGSDDKKEKSMFQPQSYSDKLMEVVWVKGSSHLGRIQSGLSSARRLGQGSEIIITLIHDSAIPVQIDGEPWMQESGVKIKLSHLEAAPMLIPSKSK